MNRYGMSTDAEITRLFKAKLHDAFPDCKFSVTRGGERIVWTDDGPTQAEVEEVIIATDLVEVHKGWNGNRYLQCGGRNNVWFDRYNAAERAAAEEDAKRQRQEYKEEERRIQQMVMQERNAKLAVEQPPLQDHAPPVIQDTSVFEAFEQLRQRAEVEITVRAAERRPSWAPPLILDEELAAACRELGYITEDDKNIARLWAMFATPKRSDQLLREHISNLPLTGLTCRGFQLFAGSARGSTHALLFEAQRQESGVWRFGPPRGWVSPYYSPKDWEWERLIRERERAPKIYNEQQLATVLARLTQQIESINAEDLTQAKAHRHRQLLHQRALELARVRVLDFIGTPDAQMRLAARLWGHCCICSKELTDPISLERGVGPDCHSHLIDFIRLNAASETVDWLVRWSGMPREFVVEVISEQRAS